VEAADGVVGAGARRPDAIPIIGVVDDLVLLPLAVRWLLSMLPGQLRTDIERRFGAAATAEPAWRRRR
jgi:uncharacterized membrane protein YkvA (DUF1232 family)